MEPFAEYLLHLLRQLWDKDPVKTVTLAARVNASERTVRLYLHRLEKMGLVGRKSPKTGWIPVLA